MRTPDPGDGKAQKEKTRLIAPEGAQPEVPRLQMVSLLLRGCRALGLSTSGDEYHPGNRTAFLYERGRWFDARWHKAHSRFLKQHPLCAFCQAEGKIVLATVVDHIIPHRGDQRLFWDQTNWEALCKECHDKKTGSGL